MLRMKPEIEAHTHEYIKTGHIESKFGIRKEEMVLVIKELIKEPNISVLGIHGHIGSQIFDVAPFEDLVNIMVSQYDRIQKENGVTFTELNLGGGIGIQYVEEYDPPKI